MDLNFKIAQKVVQTWLPEASLIFISEFVFKNLQYFLNC